MRQDAIVLTISGSPLIGTSMASSFTTDAFNLFSIYAYSVQVAWSGGSATAGAFTLQASNDAGNSNILLNKSPAPTNWTTVTGSSQTISGTPGNILYDVTEVSYRWFRLVYTAASGTGTVSDGMLNIKGV